MLIGVWYIQKMHWVVFMTLGKAAFGGNKKGGRRDFSKKIKGAKTLLLLWYQVLGLRKCNNKLWCCRPMDMFEQVCTLGVGFVCKKSTQTETGKLEYSFLIPLHVNQIKPKCCNTITSCLISLLRKNTFMQFCFIHISYKNFHYPVMLRFSKIGSKNPIVFRWNNKRDLKRNFCDV